MTVVSGMTPGEQAQWDGARSHAATGIDLARELRDALLREGASDADTELDLARSIYICPHATLSLVAAMLLMNEVRL